MGALWKAGGAAAKLAACGLGATASVLQRGRRAFHPQGCSFLATLHIDGREPLAEGLLPTGTHAAVIRLSRGLGLPDPWPDVLGLALKVDLGPEGELDLLFNASAYGQVGMHLIVPARRFFERPYSTILRFENGADHLLVGLIPPDGPDEGPTFSTLRKTWDLDGAVFEVAVAPRGSDWLPAGRLVVGDAYPEGEELVFHPGNVPGPARPAGFFNSLRPWAYPSSRLVQDLYRRDGGPGSGGPARPRPRPSWARVGRPHVPRGGDGSA